MMPPRRKKWTEEEEITLIEKYREMQENGTLAKMKTREKKFRPIAAQVNSLHHLQDPISFPWQWSWKDASTKVQNMRHQYLLVKQKIKKPISLISHTDNNHLHNPESKEIEDEETILEDEEFDWVEGLTHWSNFLRYKDVFGDVALTGCGNSNNNDLGIRDTHRNFSNQGRSMDISGFGNLGDDGFGIDAGENEVLGLGFEYNGEEGDEIHNNVNNHVKENGNNGFEFEEVNNIDYRSRKKRKKLKGSGKKMWGLLNNQLAQLKEREAHFEEQEAERERERQRRDRIRMELEQERERKFEERNKEREERERSREKMRRERIQEWEAMENNSIERERRWREEELIMEREWEQRMEQRRLDWKKRMDDMLNQHRATMDQIQSRILHDQQTVTNQLLGILSQWSGHSTGLTDHTGAGHAYLSQMIHNLHHVNGIVHGENRVETDSQDDQFIVDE